MRKSYWGQTKLTEKGIKPVTILDKIDRFDERDVITNKHLRLIPLKGEDITHIYVNIPIASPILRENYLWLIKDKEFTSYEEVLKYIFESKELRSSAGKLLGYPVSEKPQIGITHAWRAIHPENLNERRVEVPLINYMWFKWNTNQFRELIAFFKWITPKVLEIEHKHGEKWPVVYELIANLDLGRYVSRSVILWNKEDIIKKEIEVGIMAYKTLKDINLI